MADQSILLLPHQDCPSQLQIGHDQLRILGNEAYRENRMEDAIRYYSEAITASPKETIDTRLLSNRSPETWIYFNTFFCIN
jgi:hypothetical protein